MELIHPNTDITKLKATHTRAINTILGLDLDTNGLLSATEMGCYLLETKILKQRLDLLTQLNRIVKKNKASDLHLSKIHEHNKNSNQGDHNWMKDTANQLSKTVCDESIEKSILNNSNSKLNHQLILDKVDLKMKEEQLEKYRKTKPNKNNNSVTQYIGHRDSLAPPKYINTETNTRFIRFMARNRISQQYTQLYKDRKKGIPLNKSRCKLCNHRTQIPNNKHLFSQCSAFREEINQMEQELAHATIPMKLRQNSDDTMKNLFSDKTPSQYPKKAFEFLIRTSKKRKNLVKLANPTKKMRELAKSEQITQFIETNNQEMISLIGGINTTQMKNKQKKRRETRRKKRKAQKTLKIGAIKKN